MIRRLAALILAVVAASAPLAVALEPAPARAQGAQQQVSPMRRGLTYEQQQEKINAWTVGLAAGRIEGAPLRLAAEMARVVDDGANMLVLPIVTRGPVENLNSLLYLRGVDMAIINPMPGGIQASSRHAAPHRLPAQSLPVGTQILCARDPEHAGYWRAKKVNLNTLGTAAATGPAIFRRRAEK